MPNATWSAKRERQYKHIKKSLKDRGDSEELAEEIAARTVNKQRAQHGETKKARKTSSSDMYSYRRGGVHSRSSAARRTYPQLYKEAQENDVKGRSAMNKEALERALNKKK
jgi:hypothetical protein